MITPKEALEFYADPANWTDTPSWDGDPDNTTPKAIPILRDKEGHPCDCGDTARKALAALDASIAGAWRCEIKYGPEGEANYAWVYDAAGDMVCTAKTHHAEAIVARMNSTASFEGEDAVERMARIIDPNAGWGVKLDSDYIDLRHEQARLEDKQRIALTKARAILATGLVPDEAAIRADEREKCAQIAEDDERQDEWPKSVDVKRTSPSRIMQRTIAAAIRSNRREA